MEVVRPCFFTTSLGAQCIDFEAPLYDGDYVNGAVVPFSWEEKPGVPLMMSPTYLGGIKTCELYTHTEAGSMLSPNYLIVNNKEKDACVQNSMQPCPTQFLSSLPKPPVDRGIASSTSNCLESSISHAKTHTPKQRRSPLHTYITTIFMSKANSIDVQDDPFLKAIQACTTEQTSIMQGPNQDGNHARRMHESPRREVLIKDAAGADLDASPGYGVHRASLSKLFEDQKVLIGPKAAVISKQFDDKLLNNKLNGSIDEHRMLNLKSPSSKLNLAIDYDMLLNTNTQLSKRNGAVDDKLPCTNALLSKLHDGTFDNNKTSSINSPLCKFTAAPNTKPQLSKLNYQAAVDKKKHGASCYMQCPMGKSNGGEAGAGKKGEGYDGHPAFMVASFQQSAKQKKLITQKRAQGRPLHHRSSGYGCLGCRSADSYDSIVRI